MYLFEGEVFNFPFFVNHTLNRPLIIVNSSKRFVFTDYISSNQNKLTMKSYIKTITFLAITMLFIGCSSNNNVLNGEKNTEASNNNTEQTNPETESKKTDGAIMGSVIAPNSEVLIVATNSEEKITGTTNDVGEFFIKGFPEGTYTVTIKTNESEQPEQTFENVEVRIGEVTALGTVTVASN